MIYERKQGLTPIIGLLPVQIQIPRLQPYLHTLPPTNTRRQHSTVVTQNSERSALQESKCVSKRKPSFCKRSICRHPEARKTIRRARLGQIISTSATRSTLALENASSDDMSWTNRRRWKPVLLPVYPCHLFSPVCPSKPPYRREHTSTKICSYSRLPS